MKGPYAHLLLRSPQIPATQLKGTQLTFLHIALSQGLYTPYIQAHEKWTTCSVKPFASALNGVRWMTWKHRPLAWGIFHESFMVAPSEWPTGMNPQTAFGLQEAPTPYEVACAVLQEPAKGFFQMSRGADERTKLSISVAYWWLMGLHPKVIQSLLGREALVSELRRFIRHAMSKPRFRFWALGTNPVPLCTNRQMASIAASLMGGRPIPGNQQSRAGGCDTRVRKLQKDLLDHPSIRIQIKTGRRINPVERPLYSSGIIWQRLSKKLIWEKSNSSGASRYLKGRKILTSAHKTNFPFGCIFRYISYV
jgi:hypothetical protein